MVLSPKDAQVKLLIAQVHAILFVPMSFVIYLHLHTVKQCADNSPLRFYRGKFRQLHTVADIQAAIMTVRFMILKFCWLLIV